MRNIFRNAGVAHVLDPRFKDTLLVGRDAVDLRSNVLAWITEHAEGATSSVDVIRVTSDLTRSPPAKKRSFLGKYQLRWHRANTHLDF